MSTTLADQLKLMMDILTKPLPVQLAITGLHTKVNCSTTVTLRYQSINEPHWFDIMNHDGYDLILGTPFMFQHQVLLGFNLTSVVIKSPTTLPLKGDQITVLASRTMDVVNARLEDLHKMLRAYAGPICKDALQTPLPPLWAINHTIPLIDESKVYPWRPSWCPAPLHHLWQDKHNAYLSMGCLRVESGINAMPMLMLHKCGQPGELARLWTVIDS